MKKILSLIFCVCLLCCLAGCSYNTRESDRKNNDNRMCVIYNDGYCIIYVDNETGCQYLSRVNSGTCLMVDEQGKPLIYEKRGDS